jgi:carbon storage regulator CsrA
MALVITRRVGEVLVIGENIKVTVVGVNGQQVRIAIDAGLPHPKLCWSEVLHYAIVPYDFHLNTYTRLPLVA